jgi:CRP-like cAMP-binding protein
MKPQSSPPAVALDELYKYLSGFISLSRSEFDRMQPYIEIREFDKKEKILREGETEGYLNIVFRGLVRQYIPTRDREVTIQLATEGHVVHSELSFHNRKPSVSELETIESTTLLSITYEHLQELYDLFPFMEKLGRLMISDLFIRQDKRYIDQLGKSTRQRFLEYVRSHPHMLQRVPQKYLASYLNIKPETFSRLKHLLRPRKT